ncbi:MAG: ATP-binding cassette domain-containing protein, partial [Paracoccaceae bacterium]
MRHFCLWPSLLRCLRCLIYGGAVLELNDLTIAQGSFRLTANWTVPDRQKVAIIGPSGAGKSSLLMAIAGFLTPKSGQICWA